MLCLKENEQNVSQDNDRSQIIQADSTSNNNSTTREQSAATSIPTKSNQHDCLHPGPSSTTDPIQSSDQQLHLMEDHDHEEYVPLSAEEMLAQSFLDPKVPWSTEDGKVENGNENSNQEPNIKYAYVYGPCVMAEIREATTLTRKEAISSPPFTPTKGSNHFTYGRHTLGDTPRGDAYHWERKTQETQNNLAAN